MHKAFLWLGRYFHRLNPTRWDDACCSFCHRNFYDAGLFAEGPAGAMICGFCANFSSKIIAETDAVVKMDEIRQQVKTEWDEKIKGAWLLQRWHLRRKAKRDFQRKVAAKLAEAKLTCSMGRIRPEIASVSHNMADNHESSP